MHTHTNFHGNAVECTDTDCYPNSKRNPYAFIYAIGLAIIVAIPLIFRGAFSFAVALGTAYSVGYALRDSLAE